MYKVGSSIDIHRLIPGDGIMLGGIKVPCEYKAEAHSDGDVVLHALTEALLGALGEKDLGENFPDTDPKYKGIASTYFVENVLERVKKTSFKVNNVDITLCLQSPKLGEYKEKIRENIAKMLEIDVKNVTFKAGTFEKVGPIGHNEAVLAMCYLIIQNS